MSTFDPEAVREWIADDPDDSTRAELTRLLAIAEGEDTEATAPELVLAELDDSFNGTLEFGTAGLRGAIGPGPNRMNRAVVIRAAAGLSAYLREQVGPGFTVVIGNDARHRSRDFALDTAAVVTGAGGRALLLPDQLPTPVLAFAVRELEADAGVMVTASHNPPQDNGYKVYLGGRAVPGPGQGTQIVPPMDADIAAHIAAVPSVASVPRPEAGWEDLGDNVLDAYLARVAALVPVAPEHARLGIVLTSMHGVGAAAAKAALAGAGFTTVDPVAEQDAPDPAFPTVAFPNPEEAGALDLALALAAKTRADLVIANDPDADRFSAAVPTSEGWRQLSGDEVGLLLGADTARRVGDAGDAERRVLAASLVSSRALGAVADAHGLTFVPTLTGFKWIARVPGLAFGYEEALGYCVDPEVVRDKDGISAAVRFAALAARLKAEGRSVQEELDDLAIRHGVFVTAPLTFRVDDLSLIAGAMDRLRVSPPTSLGGSPVTEVIDLAEGSDALPPTDGLWLATEAGDRVVVRPSGTEPKLKCYLEAVGTAADAAALEVARGACRARLAAMEDDLRAALAL